ncbi:PAS domain-containing sensor histidine kinase [Algoriphagus litoralis]|uniref:PAS domain-containing sensor histidine kinase n=1 Tax=Algoriphagus litoralis TaxID=2202829 RepID=UPI000DB970AC|nr:HAMP domain-containing sensor histidine kinase [Algoriphagus litoralis]
MKSLTKLPQVRLKTLESISTLITETLDASILLLYALHDSERKLLFQSGLEPTEIPSSEKLKTHASLFSKNITIIEDLRKIDKEANHFTSLLNQGILCCCKIDLVNDKKQHLGELYLMDYTSHKISFANLQLLESIRDLTTQILERDFIDRQIIQEKEDSRSINRIVLEATQLAGAGGLCLNLDTKTLFWYKSNNAILELPMDFQLSYSDLLGESQSFDKSRYPQLAEFAEQVRRGLENLRSNDSEGTFMLQLDKKRHFHFSLHKSKEIIYLVFKDNTSLIEVGKELIQVQSLLKAEESQLLTAGWTLNLKDREMSWSENVKVFLELSEGTLPSWDVFVRKLNMCDSCDPEHIVEACLSTKGKFEKDAVILLESGKKRHIRIQCIVSQSLTGDILLLGNLWDNTEAKQTESQVEKLLAHIWWKENYLDGFLFNETFFLVIARTDGSQIYINQHYKDFFFKPGEQSEESHDPINDILEEDRIHLHAGIQKAVNNPGSNVRVYFRKVTWDKKIIYTQWDLKALMDENNNPLEVLAMGIDISEIQSKKEELKELIDLVSKQNTQLIEYNSILSHNIRNHVANLKGLANLIDLAHDPKDIVHYFGLIKEAISILDQRIQAINYLSKQKEKNKIKEEFIALNKIISNSKAFFEDEIELIGADFFTIGEPELLDQVFSPVLERILIQLLSNCIKFRSPKRTLTIQIKVVQKGEKLVVAVQDNGIGMDVKKNKVNSTDSFELKKLEPNSKGLGIYLAKHLTEALEGTINFVSRIDFGTKVILTFSHVR